MHSFFSQFVVWNYLPLNSMKQNESPYFLSHFCWEFTNPLQLPPLKNQLKTYQHLPKDAVKPKGWRFFQSYIQLHCSCLLRCPTPFQCWAVQLQGWCQNYHIFKKMVPYSKPCTLTFLFEGFWGSCSSGCRKKNHQLSFLKNYPTYSPPQTITNAPPKKKMLMKLESFSIVFHFQVPTVTPSKF